MPWGWCERPSQRHLRAMREVNRLLPDDRLMGKRAWNRLCRQRERLYRRLMG